MRGAGFVVVGIGFGMVSLVLAACSADNGTEKTAAGGAGGEGTSTSTSTGIGAGSSSSSTSTGGAGQGGSGQGGGPTNCADLPLCDDFEAAVDVPNPAIWQNVSPNCGPNTSVLSLDTTTGHSGTKSVKIVGGGGYCDHIFLSNATAIKTIGPVVYGRFYVRLSDALGGGHTTFMGMKDMNDAGGKDLRMGGQNQILMWNRESDDATLPALSPAGVAKSTALSPMTWTCVEFMVDGNARMLKTWIEGTEIEGLVVDNTPTPDIDQPWLGNANWKPSLQDLKLGWESYAGQSMTIWFDDIALSGSRIGCK